MRQIGKQYKGNYKGNKKSYENNAKEPVNEFSSYESRMTYSSYYFGLNIFDLYSQEQLANLVKDPMANNELLREISIVLYGTNGIFTNTVDYMTAMPTLDRVIVTHGSNKANKKKNKELMGSVLRTIREKEIMRDALWRGMVEGTAFYYFETATRPKRNKKFMSDYEVDSIVEINDVGVNASIISLPAKYTKIVGIKNSSYVIAFNLDYFTHGSGETIEQKLKKMPKEIRDAYHAKKEGKPDTEGGTWVVLDNSRTIVHKIRSSRSEQYGRPLVLAAISDILYDDYFTSTKRNVLGEINNKVVYQTLPEGQTKGTCALTQAQQKKQHETVKSAVMNKNNRGGTSFFTVSAGTKMNTLDVGNTDIFDEKYEAKLGDKIAASMGIASSLLNGSSSGSYSSQENNLQLITAQLFMWIDQISAELNKCISAHVIKDNKNWVEVKYLPITHINKREMVGFAKDLYLQGKGSISLWASACGIAPEVFFAMCDEELETGVWDKYPIHETSFNTSGSNNNEGAGRPETENPTEKTIQSRGNNGNNMPSPSDNK